MKTKMIHEQSPGALVRHLRKLGWSQARIADHIGTSQPTISRWARDATQDQRFAAADRLRKLVDDVESFT